jgi:hypothetical protein
MPREPRKFRSVHAERLAHYLAARIAYQTAAFKIAPDTGHPVGHNYRTAQ